MAFENQVIGRYEQALVKRARRFLADGTLTNEARRELVARVLKTPSADAARTAARFADAHGAPEVAAIARYQDALTRSATVDRRLAERFPKAYTDGTAAFIREVMNRHVEGTTTTMLEKLVDPALLDASSGASKLARELLAINRSISQVEVFDQAAYHGLIEAAMPLGDKDIPVQVARALDLTIKANGNPLGDDLVKMATHLREMQHLPSAGAQFLDVALPQAKAVLEERDRKLADASRYYVEKPDPIQRYILGIKEVRKSGAVSTPYGFGSFDHIQGKIRNEANARTKAVIGNAIENIGKLEQQYVPEKLAQPGSAASASLVDLLDSKVNAGEWQLYKAEDMERWHQTFVDRVDAAGSVDAVTDRRRSLFQTLEATSGTSAGTSLEHATRDQTRVADVKVAFDQFGHLAPPATPAQVIGEPGNYIVKRQLPGKPGEYDFVPVNSADSRRLIELAKRDMT